jgi:hypothetical protein
VPASTVVEPLEVADDVFASVCFGGVNGPVNALVFEHREERFRQTVFPHYPAKEAWGGDWPDNAYDNALAETVNGYYKAELVRGPARKGPWKTIEQLELATLTWVHWHNTERLHGYLGDVPPAEFEATFYAGANRPQELAEIT